MILAHIFGIPVEETLLPWLGSGAGAGVLYFSYAIARRAFERR